MGDLKRSWKKTLRHVSIEGFGQAHDFAMEKSPLQRLKRGVLGDQTYDKLHPIGTAARLRAFPAPSPPVIPMPDEEALLQAKKRMNRGGRSGRASTILTDEESGMGL